MEMKIKWKINKLDISSVWLAKNLLILNHRLINAIDHAARVISCSGNHATFPGRIRRDFREMCLAAKTSILCKLWMVHVINPISKSLV